MIFHSGQDVFHDDPQNLRPSLTMFQGFESSLKCGMSSCPARKRSLALRLKRLCQRRLSSFRFQNVLLPLQASSASSCSSVRPLRPDLTPELVAAAQMSKALPLASFQLSVQIMVKMSKIPALGMIFFKNAIQFRTAWRKELLPAHETLIHRPF